MYYIYIGFANDFVNHMTKKDKPAESDNLVRLNRANGQFQDEYLYEQIFDAILDQRLLPGTKLTEDDLADIFAVSRAVVRRSLLRLSHDRIVTIRPNRGAFVASPGVKQAREILAARRLIESAIVREAVAAASASELSQLRGQVHEEKEYFEHNKRGSGIRLSGDFHFRLALLSANTTLIKFVKELIPQTSLIIAQYEKPGHSMCSHDEHFALIDVIADGDAEKAVALMDRHLQNIENKLDLSDDDARTDLRQVFADIVKPPQDK